VSPNQIASVKQSPHVPFLPRSIFFFFLFFSPPYPDDAFPLVFFKALFQNRPKSSLTVRVSETPVDPFSLQDNPQLPYDQFSCTTPGNAILISCPGRLSSISHLPFSVSFFFPRLPLFRGFPSHYTLLFFGMAFFPSQRCFPFFAWFLRGFGHSSPSRGDSRSAPPVCRFVSS